MSALIVIQIAVEDSKALKPYQELARPTMQTFGIELVAKSTDVRTLEGQASGNMIVILRAESVEVAERWYGSEAYRKAVAARDGVARFTTSVMAG